MPSRITLIKTFPLLALLALLLHAEEEADIIFEGFEQSHWGGWSVEGSAFGAGPIEVEQSLLRSTPFPLLGQRLIDTKSLSSHTHTGSLTSPIFTAHRDYIHFALAGGSAAHARVSLCEALSHEVLYTASGRNSNALSLVSWDISRYQGYQLYIKIEDLSSHKWSYLLMDTIVFSNDQHLQYYGALSAEQWNGIEGYDVLDLTQSPQFYQSPDTTSLASSNHPVSYTHLTLPTIA